MIGVKSFRNVVGGEVRFSIPPNSPCPCGSGEAASRCCLTAAGFRKVPASTVPPAPRTHDSLESCYVSPLADCSSKRSREHYISESLLHYLNRNNDLTVSGLPWVEGEHQVLPPSAVSSRVLCERHNSALSPLDVIAVRLFQAFDEEGAAGSGQQLLYLFSGHDLERWLLKILCGITCSKNLPLDVEADLSIEILVGYLVWRCGVS
ncbi:MAG: SEC-C metal-binding domain-containing protein [Candidatus Binatia bacterium]